MYHQDTRVKLSIMKRRHRYSYGQVTTDYFMSTQFQREITKTLANARTTSSRGHESSYKEPIVAQLKEFDVCKEPVFDTLYTTDRHRTLTSATLIHSAP